MGNPTFTVGGLASGLDTAGIIDSLVAVERQPIIRYQNLQRSLRAKDDAWGKVVQRVAGIRGAVDDIRRSGELASRTVATSSDEDAVSVTSTGGGQASELSFRVEALAKRHSIGFDGSFGSPTELVDAGTLTFTDETGGEIGTVTTDGTQSLADLAAQIDALGIEVDATVLKVGEDDHRLVLSATGTGVSGRFGVTSTATDLGAASELTLGDDARLSVGGLVISRASNTIDDLVEGASLTLRSTTTTDVTVGVARDDDAIVEDVQALVDQFNQTLTELDKLTSYDPESGVSGILQNESLARDLAFELRSALFEVVGDGGLTYAGNIGIELSRQGEVTLDETRLRAALADDADGVFSLLSQSLGGDAGVELSFVGEEATSGDFAMTVSQAASVASATGATYTPPMGSPKTFTIATSGGDPVSVTIDEGMSASDAVARINAALEAAEVRGTRASVGDDGAGNPALQLESVGYGSARSFTVSGYGVDLDGTHTGTDVVADFGSGSVTGAGQSLDGTGAAAGLTLRVTGGTGTYDLSYSGGVGGVLDRFLDSLEGTDGLLQQARNSIDEGIRDFDDQIEAFEVRIGIREASLRRKYAALESTLGNLQSQGSWLAGQLASLPTR